MVLPDSGPGEVGREREREGGALHVHTTFSLFPFVPSIPIPNTSAPLPTAKTSNTSVAAVTNILTTATTEACAVALVETSISACSIFNTSLFLPQPDEARAHLHHYFAAMGGDPLSRMALGARHATGQGVPASCWSAAAYYAPVAEEVGGTVHSSGLYAC